MTTRPKDLPCGPDPVHDAQPGLALHRDLSDLGRLGRVSLLAFARQDSVYASALVWTAVEEDIVLLVPSSASSLAWAQLDQDAHPVLEVLLGLPITVADDLDARRAPEIGQLLRGRDARIDVAHAALCSQRRSWPLVTGEPAAYAALHVPLEIEPLP